MKINSELQANNKKVGQAAMKFAEEHQLIPSGQCGARKEHEAMALVISKRCVWDLLRQQRRAAGWISNDAKSCFDRIVHWVGMVALLRLGIPWPAVVMMFATLQLATHRVRTGFGDSILSFAPPSDIPFQGCGQGNGAGPTIWLAISAILIDMMRAAGFGFACLSALSGLLVLADCLCFMDDSDVIHAAQTVHTSGESLFWSVQRAMDLWAGGIRATGGALNPPKCFWWLIDFVWRPASGTWVFRRKAEFDWRGPLHRWQRQRPAEQLGALLTPDLDGQLVAIKQLEPDQAEKTLGVMMSPLDDGAAQFTFLREKTQTWAHKVQSGRLQKYDVLPMIKSTIMKTIEYPMALTHFTQKQWFNIMSPALMAGLPKAGVCRNFPRNMVFAPLRFQGLGLPHPRVTQVMHHLSVLQKHLTKPSQSTPYLKAVLEGHRLETGTSFPLFQQVFQNTAILTTDTWVKRVWEELDSLEVHVEPEAAELPVLRQGDRLLMDVFLDALPPQEELKWLNWCRMYLNVVSLSEIVTADGRYVTTEAWNGTRLAPRRTQLQWPRTSRPAISHWDKWRYWIQKTLLLPGAPTRLLRQPLGLWQDDIHDWDWVFSKSQNCLFFRDGHGWTSSEPSSSTLRSSSRTYRFPKPRLWDLHSRWVQDSLPADIQRASVSHLSPSTKAFRMEVAVTGLGDELGPEQSEEQVPSLLASWRATASTIVGSVGWVPEKIVIEGDETLLWHALSTNELRIVSDGSFKNRLGTAVVQLRAEAPGNAIWVYCQTPGKQSDQSAYRSELIGILAGVMVASWLYKEWDPGLETQPLVKFACDGLSALRNCFANSHLNPQQPQFDLVSAIQRAITESGIHWYPLHVKGHADSKRKWDQLTWWEKRNVEVDRKATELRDQLESEGRVQARNPRFFSEPCAVFVRGEKISSLDRTIFEDLIVLPQLEEDWMDQRNLSPEAIQLVDWQVVQRSMKSLPAGIQRWCTKHVTGMCGVGKFRERWGLDDKNRCPLCSLAEDHHHVPRCGDTRVIKEWNTRVDELRLWMEHTSTAPYLQRSLLSLLARVREPLSPLWHEWQFLPPGLQQTVLSAQMAQDIIGPQGLLEGLLSSEWAPIQEAHFRSLGNRRSGNKWAAQLSHQLIMLGFHMWTHRNSVQHSDDSVQNRAVARTTDAGIRRQFLLGCRDLPPNAKRQFRHPVKEVLELPLPQRVRWLSWVKLERARVERLLNARRRMIYDFAHADMSRVRKVRRTRRVFKTTVQQKRKRFRQQHLCGVERSEGPSVTP